MYAPLNGGSEQGTLGKLRICGVGTEQSSCQENTYPKKSLGVWGGVRPGGSLIAIFSQMHLTVLGVSSGTSLDYRGFRPVLIYFARERQ